MTAERYLVYCKLARAGYILQRWVGAAGRGVALSCQACRATCWPLCAAQPCSTALLEPWSPGAGTLHGGTCGSPSRRGRCGSAGTPHSSSRVRREAAAKPSRRGSRQLQPLPSSSRQAAGRPHGARWGVPPPRSGSWSRPSAAAGGRGARPACPGCVASPPTLRRGCPGGRVEAGRQRVPIAFCSQCGAMPRAGSCGGVH